MGRDRNPGLALLGRQPCGAITVAQDRSRTKGRMARHVVRLDGADVLQSFPIQASDIGQTGILRKLRDPKRVYGGRRIRRSLVGTDRSRTGRALRHGVGPLRQRVRTPHRDRLACRWPLLSHIGGARWPLEIDSERHFSARCIHRAGFRMQTYGTSRCQRNARASVFIRDWRVRIYKKLLRPTLHES